jgi:hypothetical protein
MVEIKTRWDIVYIYMEMPKWNFLYRYLRQTKMSFFKNRDHEVKQVLSEDWCQWQGGRYKGTVWEGENGENIIYLGVRLEKWDMLKLS